MEDVSSNPKTIHVLTEDELNVATISTLNAKKVEIYEAQAATIEKFRRLKTLLRKEYRKSSLVVPKAIESIEEQLAGLDLDESWKWHADQMLKTSAEQAGTIREIKVKTKKTSEERMAALERKMKAAKQSRFFNYPQPMSASPTSSASVENTQVGNTIVTGSSRILCKSDEEALKLLCKLSVDHMMVRRAALMESCKRAREVQDIGEVGHLKKRRMIESLA